MVIDGRESPVFDDYKLGSPVFSADGSRVAYAVKSDDTWKVVVDNQESPPYQDILGLGFLADSSPVYAGKSKGEWVVSRNNLTGPAYKWIRKPGLVISADHKRMAYVGHAKDREEVVVDGKNGRPYKKIGFVRQSGGAKAGDYGRSLIASVFVSILTAPLGYGVAFTPTNRVQTNYLGGVQFSPDSEHYAYLADDGKSKIVVIDGVESRLFPLGSKVVALRFSAESDNVRVFTADPKIAVAVIPVPPANIASEEAAGESN